MLGLYSHVYRVIYDIFDFLKEIQAICTKYYCKNKLKWNFCKSFYTWEFILFNKIGISGKKIVNLTLENCTISRNLYYLFCTISNRTIPGTPCTLYKLLTLANSFDIIRTIFLQKLNCKHQFHKFFDRIILS